MVGYRIVKMSSFIIHCILIVLIMTACASTPVLVPTQPSISIPSTNTAAGPTVTSPAESSAIAIAPIRPNVTPTPFSLKNINRSDFPVSGLSVPALTAYDDAMWNFMQSHDIQAGTITVVKNGKNVLSRGYGWLDSNRTIPLPPNAFFRAPSPNKTLTAIAINQLIQKGQLSLDTKLIPLLQLAPVPGSVVDPQMNQITIGQALDTIPTLQEALAATPTPAPSAGQNKPGIDIVVLRQGDVIHALGLSGPPTAMDIARYAVSQSMNFIKQGPHGNEKLSYLFLGLAVEKVTGQAYLDYVQKNILLPLNITDVKPARSLPDQRDSKEPFYISTATCDNVISPVPAQVPCADGGFSIEALYGTNGLLMTGPDIAKLMSRYTFRGDEYTPGQRKDNFFIGFLPGTTTIERWQSGDVEVVVLLNKEITNDIGLFGNTLDSVTKHISNWL